MRNKSFAMLVMAFLLSISLIGGTAGAADSAANDGIGGDIARMYRVGHTLTLNLKRTSATLDGKAFTSDKPIVKNGRVYITLRALWQSGAAESVTWDSKKREAFVVMKPELGAALSELGFRVGSDQLYWRSGEPLGFTKIPAPFLSGGRVYIPIQALSNMGVTASTAQSQTKLSWSDKIVELKQTSWTTDQETVKFSVLYQADMFAPQLMQSYGSSASGGGTGELTDKSVSLDGVTYKRMSYTISLRPGVNPLQIYSQSGAIQDFTIYREVADPKSVPVTILEEGASFLSLTAPASGYVIAKPGETIAVEGSLLSILPSFDKVTLRLERYEPSGRGIGHANYVEVNSVEVAIRDGKIAGFISVGDKPGYYLLSIDSPKYIPFVETGPAATEWAEIVVQVTDK